MLSLPLPLLEQGEVQVHRSVFDELIVHIGNWKRNIALPMGLAKLDVDGAKYDDDRLNIYFLPTEDEEIPAEALATDRWASLRTRFSGSDA